MLHPRHQSNQLAISRQACCLCSRETGTSKCRPPDWPPVGHVAVESPGSIDVDLARPLAVEMVAAVGGLDGDCADHTRASCDRETAPSGPHGTGRAARYLRLGPACDAVVVGGPQTVATVAPAPALTRRVFGADRRHPGSSLPRRSGTVLFIASTRAHCGQGSWRLHIQVLVGACAPEQRVRRPTGVYDAALE